jgi:serine/threonine protein kinase
MNRASLSLVEFCRFSIPELKCFAECQFSRPERSHMMFDFITSSLLSPYVATEVIGHSSSSTVLLVNDPEGVGRFAIKRFHPHISQSLFMVEIETLVRLNHPCILRILKYALPTRSSQAEIHLELAQNGWLARFLKHVQSWECPTFWNPTGIAIIIMGIDLGMQFMHSRGFIHQDLNPSNILLNEQGRTLTQSMLHQLHQGMIITLHLKFFWKIIVRNQLMCIHLV